MKRLLFAAIVLILAGNSTFATDDRKSTSGAQCRPMDGNQWERIRVNATGISNASDLDTYVACTLPTDGEVPYTTGRLSVEFSANGVARTVNCSAYSGDLVVGFTSVSDSGYIRSWSRGQVGWADLPGGGSKPLGVNCRLPPKYKIVSILWSEPGPTNSP